MSIRETGLSTISHPPTHTIRRSQCYDTWNGLIHNLSFNRRHHPPFATLLYAERSCPISLTHTIRRSQRYHMRNGLIHSLSFNCSSSSAVLNVTIRGTVLSQPLIQLSSLSAVLNDTIRGMVLCPTSNSNVVIIRRCQHHHTRNGIIHNLSSNRRHHPSISELQYAELSCPLYLILSPSPAADRDIHICGKMFRTSQR